MRTISDVEKLLLEPIRKSQDYAEKKSEMNKLIARDLEVRSTQVRESEEMLTMLTSVHYKHRDIEEIKNFIKDKRLAAPWLYSDSQGREILTKLRLQGAVPSRI